MNNLFENYEKSVDREKLNVDNIGEKLWNKVKNVPCGKEFFANYENKCIEIIKISINSSSVLRIFLIIDNPLILY